ncbi:hypothetical protein E8E11_009828 [Didymella keratinophila]|nr:hypothetical protein E8E11_009828 [Didymella keratinophila]
MEPTPALLFDRGTAIEPDASAPSPEPNWGVLPLSLADTLIGNVPNYSYPRHRQGYPDTRRRAMHRDALTDQSEHVLLLQGHERRMSDTAIADHAKRLPQHSVRKPISTTIQSSWTVALTQTVTVMMSFIPVKDVERSWKKAKLSNLPRIDGT